MNDLIDRQEAIDALHAHLMYRMGTESNKKRLDDWINSLPSAEPEIIHCKDCKYYYNVLYNGTQFEYGKCCRTFTEDVKPDDYCSRGEQDETD